ncbi:MAG: DUF2341 domain-containing protein, partial [Gammaproteobacteria bacterium]
MGIDNDISGIHLVQNDLVLGNTSLTSGQLLMSVVASDTIGNNGAAVTKSDVFTLNISSSTLADATLLFEGVESGGVVDDVRSVALFITNDAPVLGGANDLTTIDEDDFANGGTLVSDLIAGQVSDVDSGALEGIAVIAVDDSNGTWEYTTDGGSNWTAFGAVDASTARLLAADANTSVRFVPDANWNGTVTNGITFHAWDQTSGANGGTADLVNALTVRDEFSAAAYNNQDGTVNWNGNWFETDDDNLAPSGNVQITGGELRLDNQDLGGFESVARAVDLSAAVSATLDFDFRITDQVDPTDSVVLEVSSNGGSNWTTLEDFTGMSGPLADSRTYDISTYATADTQIRFRINADLNGNGEEFYIDNVQIAYQTVVNTGGSTAFSAAAASSDITVNAYPINNLPGAQTTAEDATIIFNTTNGNLISVTDTPGDTLTVTLSVDNGTLTLSQTTGLTFDDGTNGTATMIITGTVGDINAALDGLQYTPTTDYFGSDTLTLTSRQAELYSLEIDSDLLGRYQFEAATPGDDSSPSGTNDATLVGDATITTDAERGEVLSLDGNGDYAEITGNFGNPANVTLAAWVNLTAADTEGSDVINVGDNVGIRLDNPNGGSGVWAYYYDGTTWNNIASGQFVAGDGWVHVAYVFDDVADTHTIYINGTAINSEAATSSISYANAPNTRIGSHANGDTNYAFNGLIDDARVYTRALSATEIDALANAPAQSSDSDSVAITVSAVNDDPTNAGTMPTDLVFLQDTQGKLDLSAIDLSDVDPGAGSLMLTITSDSGHLQTLGWPGLTLGGSQSQLILTGSLTDLNDFLNDSTAIDYEHATPGIYGNDVDQITIEISDNGNTGSGGGGTITLGTINIDIDPVAPQVDLDADNSTTSGNNFTTTWTQSGGQISIADTDAAISDADSATLQSMTVTLTNHLDGADERMVADTSGTSISVTSAMGPGEYYVYLTGADTLANYEQVLKSIVYDNTSASPDGTTRVVTVHASDGTNVSAIATTMINVVTTNSAPTITSDGGGASASINITENTTAVTTVAATDADLDVLSYSISGGADAALFSIDANSGALTFNTAPDFENPADANADNVYEVTVQASDGNGATDTQSITVNVIDTADGIRVTPINVVPIGDETLVNTTTNDAQSISSSVSSAIATDAGGDYVVVWTSNLQDGSGNGVYAQLYNADGTPQGTEFLVNTVTTDNQSSPSVAMDAAGNFVVAWQSNLQDGDNYGIYAQRFNAAGVAQGSEFPVNTTTADYQGSPGIAMAEGGDFVIIWASAAQDPDGSTGIYGQRFDAGGNAVGSEFRINTYTTGYQQVSSVSMDAAGNFVVTWASQNQDGSNYGVFGQVFNADGTSRGSEFQVNTTTVGSQLYNDVAMLDDGRFVVTYQHWNADSSTDLFVQCFNAEGSKHGSEIKVNSVSDMDYFPIPSITADASGNFTVVWNNSNDGALSGVFARSYDWLGNALTGEVQVNTTTAGDQWYPEVVAQPGGGFIVVWSGNGAGDADGVYMQRFGLATTEDGDSATFQIVLESAPTANVTIPISITDGTEGTLSLGSVTFTAGDWNVPQTVKVTGIEDLINDGDQRYQVVFGAASSADPNLDGLTLGSLTITNVDTPNQAPSSTADTYTVDEDGTLTVDWWDSDWTRRQQLSFDNLAQTETLTDMPVLIVLNASNIDYSQTNDDGSDLRFFAADGTPLAYEIEQWNESGDSTVWVKVPQITGNSNTDSITMYYGNAAATSAESPSDVWDSNFVGVWHLNQEQGGSGDYGVYEDSTANNNDGKDNVVATGQEGSIADGQEFDANDWIEIAHDPSLDLTDSMTISFWIKPTSDSGTFNRVVEKGLWGYQDSYYFGGGDGTNDLTFYLNGQEVIDTADNVLTVGVWQHAAVSYTSNGDGTGTARMYLDGVEIASGNYTSGAVAGNNERLGIGHHDSDYDFDGFIDEVQISNTDRSADWIAAQYQAMNNAIGNEFVSFGGEQVAPATAGVLTNDADLDGDLLTVNTTPIADVTNGTLVLKADGTFTYTPDANFNGTDSFTYEVSDGKGTTAQASVTITVKSINDEPQGSDNTVTTAEDTDYVFTVADFGLTDASDSPADDLLNVIIATAPANGTLYLDANGDGIVDGGETLAASSIVSAADITAGKLKFKPAANANGTGYDSFSFQVQDDGGTVSGGVDTDASANTITIDVTAVNDAPVAVGESFTAVEGVPYTASLGFDDLLLNDSDVEGDTLTVNTTPVSGPSNGALILNADGTFTYTPNNNFNGTDSFVYEVNDGNGGTAQATATVTVQPREIRILFTTQSDVNNSKVPGISSWDAGDVLGIGDPNLSFEPVGSDGSVLPYMDLEAFAASNDMTINGLHFVSNDITVGGANSVDLYRGDLLFVSDADDTMTSTNSLAIAAGDVIVFRPDTAGDYTSGTFIHLLDQPGTAKTTGITLIENDVLIGDVTLQAGTFLFTQQSVVEESSIYHFSADDVGAGTTTGTVSTLINSVDIDVSWNNFVGVMVISEDLYLDGTMVPAGSIVTTLTGGDSFVGANGIEVNEDEIIYLTVASTTMGSGTTVADATVLFDGGDIGLNNNSKKMRSLAIIEEITPVNNVDPLITLAPAFINYTEQDPPTIIGTGATLTDPDSADLDGGLLRIDLGTTGFADDRLAINHEGNAAGQVGISGNTVSYGGVAIGTFTGGSDGSDPLTVLFNANADVAAVEAVMRNITYENVSSNPSTAQRSVAFSISDGDGGSSSAVTKTIIINNVNAAPVITGANNLTAINEDTFGNGGTLVSDLISGWISDADPAALEGIAVVGVDNTNGSWEFSIDGGSTWTAFNAPSTNSATLLAANPDTFVRFVPDPNWNGTVTNGITFHAWDQTGGVNGDVVDLTLSDNVRDQFGTVSYANDDGSAVWTSGWNEFSDNGSAASGNIHVESGKLRLDNLDGGAYESITRSADLSGAATAVLTFDYDGVGAGGLDTVLIEVSNDGGSTWTVMESMDVVGTDSGSKSYNLESFATLTTEMQLRFRIAAGFDGSGQHINFDNVDIAYSGTGIGGSSSVSVATASSSITVNAVNDAPVMTAWYDSEWSERKILTIDSNHVAGDVTDFPVFISLSVDPDLAAQALANGDDIIFTAGDGATQLAHEIEYFNEATGELRAWVKMDLSANVDTDFYLYYGNASATNQENAAGVWSSNYVGVYHLGESPTGAADELVDSSGSGNHATAEGGMDASDSVATAIGQGLAFDGVDDKLRIPDSASLDGLNDAATFSLWINWADAADGDHQIIMASENRFSGGDGYEWASQGDGDHFFYPDATSPDGNYNLGPNPFTNGQWHHLAATMDFATKEVKIYVDGDEMTFTTEGVPSRWTDLSSSGDLLFGGNPDRASRYFLGLMDEIHLADVVRSQEWIQTEVNNQTNPGAFLSVGAAEVTLTPDTLTDINEDDFNAPGDTVAVILGSVVTDRITDADSGAVEGIAVVGVDNTNGVWQYDANADGTWVAFGAVSDSSAVLLDTGAKIRFVPNADYNGPAGLLTFHAWDQTTGANGDTGIDVSVNGGTTAYSSTAYTASCNVNPVNDVPVATANTVTTSEDNVYSFSATDFTFTDVEGDSPISATITNLSLAGGTLTHSGGTVVNSGDTLSAAQLDTLVYTPAANANGAPLASFDFTVNDAGSGVVAAQMSINVTAVNDVPVATTNTVTTNEDTPFNFASTDFTYTDIDSAALVSVTITNLNLAGGTLTHSGGTAVNGGDTLIAAQLDTLVYTPPANASGTPLTTFDFTVNDAGAGVVTAQMSIDVIAVNDAPTVDNAIADQVATEDTPFSFQFSSNVFGDVDGDTLTYASDASGWLSFDAATRTFSGTPLNADVGTTTVTVTADDGNGGTISDTFDIVISNTNDAPTVENAIA